MLEIEEWFMIKDLYAQGFSIRAISKKTGFNRRTVSKYLNNKSLPESKKRSKKTSKLGEYKDYITIKLHKGPCTAARDRNRVRGFLRRVSNCSSA